MARTFLRDYLDPSGVAERHLGREFLTRVVSFARYVGGAGWTRDFGEGQAVRMVFGCAGRNSNPGHAPGRLPTFLDSSNVVYPIILNRNER